MLGKIERWDASRGYGFIVMRDGRSFFCHASALEKPGITPVAGQEVMFDIERSPKSGRTQAASVILV